MNSCKLLSPLSRHGILLPYTRHWILRGDIIQAVDAHCEALEMVQQDLIGFFNSVPHDRILQALDLLIWRLEELFHRNVNDIVFQVDMAASTKGLRIFPRPTKVSSINNQESYDFVMFRN